MLHRASFTIALAACVLLGARGARAEDWYQWRGPGQNGITEVENLPVRWGDEENIAWKTQLPGPGSSQPVTWGGRVFVTSWTGYNPSAGRTKEDFAKTPVNETIRYHVTCLAAATGEVLWTRELESMNAFLQEAKNVNHHGMATHTPAVEEGRLYASFGTGGLFCFDHDGRELWRTSIGERFAGWGTSPSPIVHGDLLIVNASVESGALLALHKEDGSVAWRQEAGMDWEKSQKAWYNRSWSTPLLFQTGGRWRIALLVVGQRLNVYDPQNGEVLWTLGGISGGYACSTPVYDAGRDVLYCFAGGSHGTTTASAVKAGNDVQGNRFAWKHEERGSALTPPVFYHGRLYYGGYGGTRPKGIEALGALDPETGEPVFAAKPEQLTAKTEIYATPLAGDGKVYLQTRTDGTWVLDATSPEFNVLSVNRLEAEKSPMALGGRPDPQVNCFNAAPVPLAGGRLLLRSYWGLHCIGAADK